MVLAGRLDKFSQPVLVRRRADRDAMGPHRSALRHKVSKRAYHEHNIREPSCACRERESNKESMKGESHSQHREIRRRDLRQGG